MEGRIRRGRANTGILTVPEVAKYLRIPVSTMYRLVERGDLPARKVGREWSFHRAVITDWFRAPASTQLATILVVDDDPRAREVLVSALRTEPRRILAAACGEEALHISETTVLDFAVLDLALPRLSGIETVRGLCIRRPDLAVILVRRSPSSVSGTSPVPGSPAWPAPWSGRAPGLFVWS